MKTSIIIVMFLVFNIEFGYSQSFSEMMQNPSIVQYHLLKATSDSYVVIDSTKADPYKYWLTIGYWVFTNGSINLNYSFSVGKNFYKIGYVIKGSQLGGLGKDGRLYFPIDFSIGKRVQTEWFSYAFFTGPSYLWGDRKTQNYKDPFNTIGLRGDLQLLFRPANEFGFGFGLYGNLNFEKSFIGVNINLTIGNGK